ncbi:MAG: DUF3592 domain-containing protein [Bdellovibrionales bacterium]|nr:DUF3592 domain-containing protein [Bdellovibrionales bacterium]
MDEGLLLKVAEWSFQVKKWVMILFLLLTTGYFVTVLPAEYPLLMRGEKVSGVITGLAPRSHEEVIVPGILRLYSSNFMATPQAIVQYEVRGQTYQVVNHITRSGHYQSHGTLPVLYDRDHPNVARVFHGHWTWIDYYIIGAMWLACLWGTFNLKVFDREEALKLIQKKKPI